MHRTPHQQTQASRRPRAGAALIAAAIALAIVMADAVLATSGHARLLTFNNPSGVIGSVGVTDADLAGNPFFQELGTNGRTCATCHQPAQGWSITPVELRDRFDRTDGLDPIFRTNDGSNCESADVSTTKARRRAFSLLLDKGLIRIALDAPARAEFEIVDVDDPHECASPLTTVSVYRRPLPSANLKFLSTVMWDGRQSTPGQAIRDALSAQVTDAVTSHAQGARPTPDQVKKILDLELRVFATQVADQSAGSPHVRRRT